MKLVIRHIFLKTIILLVMVFLCLPCSVKREVKKSLNIPVANLEISVKNIKSIHCLSFTKHTSQRTSVSCQQVDVQKHLHNSFLAFHQIDIFHPSITRFADDEIFTPVPIYILQEHYLI